METSQRYIVREMYGQTIGETTARWQFLVLDTDDCHRAVLERHSGRSVNNNHLRRCVYEYAELLNDPSICGCGCGEELPVSFPVRRRGGSLRIYVNKVHSDRAFENRRREKRRASYLTERPS
jgi:hypothetical protein